MINQIHNTNIESETVITSPIDLRQQIKVSDHGKDNILTSRKTVNDIFLGKDKRLIVIVGPCSIHDICLLYTSPSPRDRTRSRMPSSA